MALKNSTTGGRSKTFPCKLYELLEKSDKLGYSHIISWQPGGKSFRVWKPKQLETSILPRHFKQSKFKSFLRQLNTYHFQRITSGTNRGGYAHPAFVRGKPDQCQNIPRIPDSKGSPPVKVETAPRQASFGEKSFFDVKDTMRPMLPSMPSSGEESFRSKTEITPRDLDDFVALFEPSGARTQNDSEPQFDFNSSELNFMSCMANPAEAPQLSAGELEPIPVVSAPAPASQGPSVPSGPVPIVAPPAPADPIPVLSVPGPAAPRLLSVPLPTIPAPAPVAVTISNGDLHRSESTFPRMVYRMLQDVEKNNADHIVSWINDGTAFRVHNEEAFVKQILPLYFDQTVYESFRRQLNMYGFTRVTRGPLKGTCFHKNFCRNDPSLIDLISRRKRPSNKRGAKRTQPSAARGTVAC